MLRVLLFSLICIALLYPGNARAQDNYEIQVYPSETMAPKTLLVELHSNFTVEGSTTTEFGMLPTQHQEHETIELTEGINDWSEIGFYIFTAEQSGHGVQWVGDHIRPRVRIPPRWHWPVGVSLSTEFGYARPHIPIRPGPGRSCRLWTRPSGVGIGRSTRRWSGMSTWFRRRQISRRSRSRITITNVAPQGRDLRPGGNADVCAVEILQLRRGVLLLLRPVREISSLCTISSSRSSRW